MVEYLTQDRGVVDLSLNGVTALCPSARHINPSLVLVQPRKTRPYIAERLLMGCKEEKKKNGFLLRLSRHFCQVKMSAFYICYICIYLSALQTRHFFMEGNDMNPDPTAPMGTV